MAWFWIPYLFFSFAATKMEAYTIISAPAVFIITGIAVVQLKAALSEAKGRKRIFYVLGLIGLVGLPVRYSIERLKPFTEMDRGSTVRSEIAGIERSPYNNKQTVLYNSKYPVETMFYTNCIAYERSIDSATILSLQQKGYRVADAQSLPGVRP
jgi:4-amino-4-deoxy-L-arabinose transferase